MRSTLLSKQDESEIGIKFFDFDLFENDDKKESSVAG